MGNIIRYCIIAIHILLGLILMFYSFNALMFLTRSAFKSNLQVPVFQYIFGNVLWMILGIFSIGGALTFRKDKKWATLTLPLLPLVLSLWLVYKVYSVPKSEVAWTGGIMIFMAFVLFVFFVIEILYITLRKQAQSNNLHSH